MDPFPNLVLPFILASRLMAGTVVITTLPDDNHPLDPLVSFGGIPLDGGCTIRIGAFPGLSDDQLLNSAAAGGLAWISTALVPFGGTRNVGEGTGGVGGAFEIAVNQKLPGAGPVLVGETVSLLITLAGGQEFMVARFPGKVFAADPETGLEPFLSLHLAEAKIIVGNQYGKTMLATSVSPGIGAFTAWINGYGTISDPANRTPAADADGDGRSNFLEYATGGDPGSPTDAPPCELVRGNDGVLWLRFAREVGLGSIRYTVETSANLADAWEALEGTVEPDPDDGLNRMRIRVPAPLGSEEFFRLNVESGSLQ